MSIVCNDPSNCDREHVGGMGGTPVHLPPDGVVVPGHFDHGVPSDVEDPPHEPALDDPWCCDECRRLSHAMWCDCGGG